MKQDPTSTDPKNFFNIAGCIGGLIDPSKDNDHARITLHLGLGPRTPMNKIIDFLLEAKTKNPIPLTLFKDPSTARRKNNKLSGDEIKLGSFPAPLLHHGDGGKYIQTYGIFECNNQIKVGLIGRLQEV